MGSSRLLLCFTQNYKIFHMPKGSPIIILYHLSAQTSRSFIRPIYLKITN